MEFDRLFTISAFEALRLIREVFAQAPEVKLEEAIAAVVGKGAQASGLDMEAGTFLHEVVTKDAPADTVMFYRECVMCVLVVEMPAWAMAMTLGRGRFFKSIKGDDFRDIRSVFRASNLDTDPPTDDDIDWWDELFARVRALKNEVVNERSRRAERLTIDYEREKLADLNINDEPRWVAIEDNTVGFDVLSFRPAHESTRHLQIEVKSTISNPKTFIVSRNEWRVAEQSGEDYLFYVWDMTKNPEVLHVRTVEEVRPHIPQNNEKGWWKDAIIPLNCG